MQGDKQAPMHYVCMEGRLSVCYLPVCGEKALAPDYKVQMGGAGKGPKKCSKVVKCF